MNPKLAQQLNKRREEGTFRSLNSFSGMVDFFSNDYLGLAKIPTNASSVHLYSGTGSRLISGTHYSALETEKKLADFFHSEAALIFNSGYDANLGFFGSVPQKGDTVIYDEAVHASVRDGLKMSNARSFSFRHNDVEDLEKKLLSSEGIVYVAIEGLYSMNGDLALLGPIADCCQKYGAYLVVDEAHSCGIYGKDGRGLTEAFNRREQVFARIVTFGKAYGCHGACVLGEQKLKDYLVNFSRPFIYSTALPPESYQRIGEMINHPQMNYKRAMLMDKILLFRKLLPLKELISEINSPIQMLRIGDISKTKRLAERLQEAGFALKPIYSPTVPKGQESIRICIHADNTEEEIVQVAEIMMQLRR